MKSRKLFCTAILFFYIFLVSQASVFAESGWRQIRTKNFNLVGNAADEDIRRVGAKLEQFREVFGQIFKQFNLNSPIPTNVVVFKDNDSYKPFKPLKNDGQIDNFIIGYFQPGEDVNYITLSVNGNSNKNNSGKNDSDKNVIDKNYEVIFHEYTHFIVENNLGNSKIPPWVNEGLAEFYSTFAIENDQDVTLGKLKEDRLNLLKRSNLIPLETFFNIDNYTLHQQGDDGVGLFYAQAWVLMHYMMFDDDNAKSARFEKFINLLVSGKNAKESFTEAFQKDYATMEADLKKYIAQKNFQIRKINLQSKLTFDSQMISVPLSEAEGEGYLGDLLYHSRRFSEAETHLQNALSLDPDSAMAQTDLGLIRMKQKKFDEAKDFLQQAVRSNPDNYISQFQYAAALSHEEMTDMGFVSHYSANQANEIREALKRAIKLNPQFTESYNLYALVCIIRNEELDQALEYINKALRIAPGNQWYQVRLAEIYWRKENFSEARRITQKILQTAAEEDLKIYSQNTLSLINSTESQLEAIKNYRDKTDKSIISNEPLTDEELAALREKAMLESLNESLRRPKSNEKRILGYLTGVECDPKMMIYYVKSDDRNVKLQSESFETVALTAYSIDMINARIGCGTVEKPNLAIITYRPFNILNQLTIGQLISVEFVPKNFRFLNPKEK